MEYYEISQEVLQYPIHGKSLLPLLRGETDKVRDGAIFGYFGKQIAWTDGKYTYFRAAKDEKTSRCTFTQLCRPFCARSTAVTTL